MPFEVARGSEEPVSGVRSGRLLAGKYLLLEPLGAGGMGQVWAARNLATDAEVAIKLLHASAAAPEAVARFRREAQASAQLAHPGIIRTFDLVEDADEGGGAENGEPKRSLAIVMERLRGKTLAEHLREHAPLSVEETVEIVRPLLDALHHAHGFGIVHRDLKPENVFLARDPEGKVTPKIFDFGISKMLRDSNPPITGGGQIVGTPYHMSPEQLRGAPIDARSDVFCAGIVLYMCLAGEHPFIPESSVRSVLAVLELDPVRPKSVPAAVWEVVRRALAKHPTARFASALDLADALSDSISPGAPQKRAPKPSENVPTLTGTRIVPDGFRLRHLGIGAAACAFAVYLGLAGSGATVANDPATGHDESREASPPRRMRGGADLVLRSDPIATRTPSPPANAPASTATVRQGETATAVRDSGFK